MERVSPEPNTGCWLWMGHADACGYGMLWVDSANKRATHISLERFAGEPRPPGAFALHSCDRPECVNPAHLRWGSQKENIADATNRGRRGSVIPPLLRGERNNHAVFTEAQIMAVRQARANGERMVALAQRYGVCYGTIKAIIYGWTWKHLPVLRRAR
jgi:hypothetical protein